MPSKPGSTATPPIPVVRPQRIPPLRSASDESNRPSAARLAGNRAIPAISRPYWSRPQPCRCFPPCGCGQSEVITRTAYHTHQVIELPVIHPEVTHWRLHQGQCGACGKTCKASLPPDQITGYGPRLTAFLGEMSGIVSVSRSAVQELCAVMNMAIFLALLRLTGGTGISEDHRWLLAALVSVGGSGQPYHGIVSRTLPL